MAHNIATLICPPNRSLVCTPNDTVILSGRPEFLTAPVRAFLSDTDYSTLGWHLGSNIGPTKRLLDGAANRLRKVSNAPRPDQYCGIQHGPPVRWVADAAGAKSLDLGHLDMPPN